MGSFTFYTHIPLLRLDSEGYRFGQGVLFPMAFDDFNSLTLGAFEDHRKAYEATAPVFYRVSVELDFPYVKPGSHNGMIELKAASDQWGILDKLGWGIVRRFHDLVVDPAWVALLLAAPASALPAPRLSVTFVLPPEGYYFSLGGMQGFGFHVQGDADQEYLFLPEAAGPPVIESTITKASNLVNFVYKAREHPEFGAAFSYLAAQSSPTLSKFEQLTLSVIALEALLLPEIRTGLQKVFARRLSNLLSVDNDHRGQLKKMADRLYGYRSAGVHGDLTSVNDRDVIVEQAAAPQALTASVLTLAFYFMERMKKEPDSTLSGEGTPTGNTDQGLDPEREVIDQPTAPHQAWVGRVPLENPPGLRTPDRLLRSNTPLVTGFSMASNTKLDSLNAPDGKAISWSPLVGLGITGVGIAMGSILDPTLVPFNVQEIISMEERDIQRDFISDMRMDKITVAGMMVRRETIAPFITLAELQPFQRTRDLGVIALRLAGYTQFIDPELLGWYVYDGSIRHRFPTVYRQTILKMLDQDQHEHVSAADAAGITPIWQMLSRYDSNARHAGIDRLLTMYRRTFDHRFLPIAAQAGLMFSTLEAMLGKFRGKDDPIQLEELVKAMAGERLPEATAWFTAEGRGFRNHVAHGFWNPKEEQVNQPLAYMSALLGVLLPQFISAWLSHGDHNQQKPGHVFTELASQRVNQGHVNIGNLSTDVVLEEK